MNIKIDSTVDPSTVKNILDALAGSVVRLDGEVELWVAAVSYDEEDGPMLNGYAFDGVSSKTTPNEMPPIPLWGVEEMEVL